MSETASVFTVPDLSNSDFATGKISWTYFRTIAEWIRDQRRIDVLDLRGAKHMKPYVVALTAAVCRKLGTERLVQLGPDDESVLDHLSRLGFQQAIGVKSQPNEKRDTNIPLEVLTERPSEGFSWSVAEKLIDEFPGGISAGLKQEIANGIDEMILNALTHSESSVGCIVVGQSFPKRRMIEATILDLGITIRGHLGRKYPELTTDEMAIRRALEEGVTGTVGLNRFGEPNGGAGLFHLREFIENTGSELAILSGSNVVCLGHVGSQDLYGLGFPGTLINVRFSV